MITLFIGRDDASRSGDLLIREFPTSDPSSTVLSASD
jgi:hypothetical protein